MAKVECAAVCGTLKEYGRSMLELVKWAGAANESLAKSPWRLGDRLGIGG